MERMEGHGETTRITTINSLRRNKKRKKNSNNNFTTDLARQSHLYRLVDVARTAAQARETKSMEDHGEN